MKYLLPLAVLVALALTIVLFINWIGGNPVVVMGRRLEPEAALSALGWALAAVLYWRNKSSPHRLATAYLKFLRERGLEPERVWSAVLLLRAGRHMLTLSDDVRFDLLHSLGAETFAPLSAAAARQPAAPPPREGAADGNRGVTDAGNLSLLSLALFSESESGMRSLACRRLSLGDGGARLVFAYLDLSEDLASEASQGAAVHLPLSDVPRLAVARINQREMELGERGFGRELGLVCKMLDRGEWPVSLPFVLRGAYDPDDAERLSVSLQELLGKRPWLMAALQRLFTSLPLAVIERYLASRQSDAYLLTFHAPKDGTLAEPLNALADPVLSSSLGGVERYRWTQYTNNARVGLVPRQVKLEHFAERLRADLSKAVKVIDALNNDKTSGGEVILHRLGLSGQDYHQVEIPQVTERKSIIKLQRLLAHGLDTPELLSVIDYAHPPQGVLAKLIDSPFLDLVGPLDPEERKQLGYVNSEKNGEKGNGKYGERGNGKDGEKGVEKRDGKEGEKGGEKPDLLRAAVLAALKVDTPAALLARLGKGRLKIADIDAGARALSSLLVKQKHPWTFDRLREIVMSYYETLQALAALKVEG